MARPKKRPEDKRTEVVNIRFTASELRKLEELADNAGMPTRRYVRETALGTMPRAKPARTRLFNSLLYELQMIGRNFQQLADVLEDEEYADWARYVGGELPKSVIGRTDLDEIVEAQLDEINNAGQIVNAIARKANRGRDVDREDRMVAFRAVRLAVDPIKQAVEKSLSVQV